MRTLADQERPRLARGVRLYWDEVRQANLLLYPEGVLTLNGSAAQVLGLCDGERTLASIIRQLRDRYNGADLDGDVRELLGCIAERGLLDAAG